MKIHDIEIVDDYLSESDHKLLSETLIGKNSPINFDWYYNPHKVCDGDDGDQLNHLFYKIGTKSNQFSLITPLLARFNLIAIHRIKANLELNKNKIYRSPFHYDWQDPITGEPTEKMSVGIYYVNTNNGYTEFEGGTVIESVANRMIVFPGNLKHRGVTQTDTKVRCVINFNLFAP